VALDLPDDVRDGLAAWQATALEDEALRALRPEALHVTLCFLGYRPESDIERIAAALTGIEPRPVRLRFDDAAVPVPRSRPRLFALGAESEDAVRLQAELSAVLESQRLYRPEKRPFWTHMTVARVRSERRRSGGGRRSGARLMRVAAPPAPLPSRLRKPFEAVRMALYRSKLRPAGAEYASLAELDLPPAGAEKG
jgi:2'-5' RNA ligase